MTRKYLAINGNEITQIDEIGNGAAAHLAAVYDGQSTVNGVALVLGTATDESYREGFDHSGTDGYLFVSSGRYLLNLNVSLARHATAWLGVSVAIWNFPSVTKYLDVCYTIPPTSVFNFAGHEVESASTVITVDVGQGDLILHPVVTVTGANATMDLLRFRMEQLA